MDILAFYAQRVSMMIRRDNLSAVNCTSVSVTTSSTKMNFGFLPKFITIRCMVINFSARAATFVLIAGMILLATTDNAWVCWIGVGLIAVSALFSIVTLPVEYNASERALAWLESSRTMQGAELAQAREALTWAARTYLVAALSAIATVLYYAMLILGRGNNRD